MKPSLFRLGSDSEKPVVEIFTQQNTGQKLPVVQLLTVDVIAGKAGRILLFEPVQVSDENGRYFNTGDVRQHQPGIILVAVGHSDTGLVCLFENGDRKRRCVVKK
ncbi:Uncharacterised protein [Enterobacter cloacae]|nr:Uncharacterised protein [Enterobacter cloacae]